jgi:hypothetical protein
MSRVQTIKILMMILLVKLKRKTCRKKKWWQTSIYRMIHTYSSSSILNQFGDTYNLSQKKFIHKIKSENKFK